MAYDLQANLMNGKTSREGHQLSIWEMKEKKSPFPKENETDLSEKQQLWEATRTI